MTTGLRRQVNYFEAVELLKHNPVIGHLANYAATEMIRSPLFQRMGDHIEATATKQTLGNMNEVRSNVELKRTAIEGGVSEGDLRAHQQQYADRQSSVSISSQSGSAESDDGPLTRGPRNMSIDSSTRGPRNMSIDSRSSAGGPYWSFPPRITPSDSSDSSSQASSSTGHSEYSE